MPTFIPEGCIEQCFIDGVDRLYRPVRFRYQPATIEEGSELVESLGPLNGRQADQAIAKWLDGRIVEWDLTDSDGMALPLTSATFLRLNRVLFNRLAMIVFGVRPSDVDPRQSVEE